jgi:phosphoribosyl 1,2-cyclic phosphodiesterase
MVEDQIIFLGVGGGRIVVSNQLVATGGFVLNASGYQILVDPGPGALVRGRQFGVKINKTNIIFVSHSHIDHANDLNAAVDAMTLGGIYQKGIVIANKTVIQGDDQGNKWLQPFYKSKLKEYFPVTPGDKITINKLNFTMTPTKHDTNCNGFRLDTENLSVGYTADTTYFDELADHFKGCKVLIMNTLRPNKDFWKTHLCSEDVVKLIERVRPEIAIIQHYGAKMLRSNPVYEAREIQRRTGVRTLAARDGMRVSLKLSA